MAPNLIYPGNGLEIGFLGLPIVFNDGQAENTLQIALTNNNFFGSLEPAQDSDIVFNQDTPLSIWFVVDVAQASADAERYWALTSYDALHDARVTLAAGPGDWDIRRSDDLSGTPLNDSLKGWRLTAREDVVLSPGQSLLLTLSGLTTDLPDGAAFGYVQVIMPHLDANNNEARNLTKTIGPITKSKVMITGERMGIGTGSPNSTLEVNGAVRARGGDPGEDGYDNNGFFFDGVGDADSGMTSLEDGDLSFYINDNHALRLQKPLADGSSGGNIRAALRGNLLMQGDAPVRLEVDGDGHFSGDLKTQGRIEDQSGLLMPVGAVIAYAGNYPPPGWLLCDGSPLPAGDEYNALRAVLRGDPDRESHPGREIPNLGNRLPDLRARFVVGTGDGDLDSQYLGETGGETNHQLTIDELPAHRHGYQFAYTEQQNAGWIGDINEHKQWYIKMSDRGGGPIDPYYPGMGGDIRAQSIMEAGKGMYHENRPPYYALTYIIKY